MMFVRTCAGLAVAGAMALSSGNASAQIQDGLVNVRIGNITILDDVNIGLAAQVAANICGVDVGPVAVLGEAVDNSGGTEVVCTNRRQGPITISDN